MSFLYKLEKSLDLLEAKKLSRLSVDRSGKVKERQIVPDIDKEAKVITIPIHGWYVTIYDQAGHDFRKAYQIVKNKGSSTIEKLIKFLKKLNEHSEINSDFLSAHILRHLKDLSRQSYDVLIANTDPLNKIEDIQKGNLIEEAMSKWLHAIPIIIGDMIGLLLSDMRVLSSVKLDKFRLDDYRMDPSLPALGNLIAAIHFVSRELKQTLSTAVALIHEIIHNQAPEKSTASADRVRDIVKVAENTLARIKAIGIRKSAAVPIRIHLVDKHPFSNFGTSLKAGDFNPGVRLRTSDRDEERYLLNPQSSAVVNVYVTTNDSNDTIKTVLAHEIGHVLFSINPEVQELIAAMAHGQVDRADKHVRSLTGSTPKGKRDLFKMPSDYGSVSYTYQGLDEPSIHHRTGNEWMAEMFMRLVVHGDRHDDLPPSQIKLFKMAIAVINGHPHAGMMYRAGQMDKNWTPDVYNITQSELAGDQMELDKPSSKAVRRQFDKQSRSAKKRLRRQEQALDRLSDDEISSYFRDIEIPDK